MSAICKQCQKSVGCGCNLKDGLCSTCIAKKFSAPKLPTINDALNAIQKNGTNQ